jgi:hypothetical protein
MSRSELARLASAELFPPERRQFSPLDGNYIGKIERGEIRWPQLRYQEALRVALQVAPDDDLGFLDPNQAKSDSVDVMKRRSLLTGVTSAVGLSLVGEPTPDLLDPFDDTDLPTHIGRDHIDHLAELAEVFDHLDNSRGGAATRRLADQRLRFLAKLLTLNCPASLRQDLHTALGQLAGVVGFMLFDAYDHDNARRRFTFALRCAEIGGNWHQRAMLLSSLARQAIWCGQPDDGLTYIEMALVRSDRLTATERAMMHTVRARALAKFGSARAQEALAAVGAADEAFTDSKPAEDPTWMRFYDSAQHHGDTAHALFDVAVLSDHQTDAVARFEHSVTHHSPEYARSRAISRTKLATLVMRQGDPHEASAIGQRALDDAGTVHSRRADALRALATAAAMHPAVDQAQALRTRITAMVGTLA